MLAARGRASRVMLSGTRSAVIRGASRGCAARSVVIRLAGDVAITAATGVYASVRTVGGIFARASPRVLVGTTGVIVAIRRIPAIARC
jgi:hypothetical protein